MYRVAMGTVDHASLRRRGMSRFEKQTSFEPAPRPRVGKREGVPAMAKLTAAYPRAI